MKIVEKRDEDRIDHAWYKGNITFDIERINCYYVFAQV